VELLLEHGLAMQLPGESRLSYGEASHDIGARDALLLNPFGFRGCRLRDAAESKRIH
jgi:hypothetical protein